MFLTNSTRLNKGEWVRVYRLKEENKRIRDMFSGISLRYDFLNRLLSLGFDRKWRRIAVGEIMRRRGGVHLDLACGTGDVALEIVRQIEGATVIGADISLPMIRRAVEKVNKRGVGCHVSFLTCAGESLPFRDSTFDSVSIAFGIRNVADRERALREMVRVLKKGGASMILEFSLPERSIFRRCYLLYFRILLPFLGGVLSDRKAYRYLPDSVLEFPPREHFIRMMEVNGFANVRGRGLSTGIVTIYVGEKGC